MKPQMNTDRHRFFPRIYMNFSAFFQFPHSVRDSGQAFAPLREILSFFNTLSRPRSLADLLRFDRAKFAPTIGFNILGEDTWAFLAFITITGMLALRWECTFLP